VKIYLGAIGKLKEPYLVAAEEEYKKRLRPYCTLAVHEAKDETALMKSLPDGARLYVFDERGESLTSAQFAELLASEAQHGAGTPLAFLVGGADGHSDAVRERAKRLLAFGRLTIAHRLVRILVLEQLYRAFKINRGEPYHRD
jgi:23S rRNA (pseudouridine1915-N3)-methyltransferase